MITGWEFKVTIRNANKLIQVWEGIIERV